MNIKNLTVALVLSLVAVAAFFAGKDVGTNQVAQPLGGGSPDMSAWNWTNNGGMVREYKRAALNTATTTPCALISPAATSTIIAAMLQINTATSTATTWTVATSTTAFATTSPLTATFSLASGKQGSMQFTGTTTINGLGFEDVNTADILPPNSYVVWGVAGTVPADTSKLNGVCQAEFLVF